MVVSDPELWHTLALALEGDFVIPASHTDPSLTRWARNTQRKAAAVVYPKSGVDVAAAIAHARRHRLLFAIKCGGHNSSGASSAEDGLVLDLSRYMRTVCVDPEAQLAYVGGGAQWGDVDRETMKYGLAALGGTVNDTGVGGLTLGGGYGWLTGRRGLVIDNLVQATVVLADGITILTSSATSHPDLFWGIRGGGSNFGVVTEFVFKLHPQRRTVYGGLAVYPREKIERLVDATARWWKTAGEDEAMLQVATGDEDSGALIMVVAFFYNGTEEEGREVFKEFLDIGPVRDDTDEIPYEKMNTMLSEDLPSGLNYYFKGCAQVTPDYGSTLKLHDVATSLITTAANSHRESINNKQGPHLNMNMNMKWRVIYQYEPLGKVLSVPFEATAFKRTPSLVAMVVMSWENELQFEHESGYRDALDSDIGNNGESAVTIPTIPTTTAAAAAELARRIACALVEDVILPPQFALGLPRGDEDGYSNHDNYECNPTMTTDSESAENGMISAAALEKSRKAFGANFERMREVKRMYDPDVFFNRWFPVPPASV